jgi:hypothetical protein
MGNFYANVTLRGADLGAVRAAAPRPAFVVSDGDHVVVFPEAEDMGELVSVAGLAQALGCLAVGAGVHDDDLLFWEVHDGGTLVTEGAVSDPALVFGMGEPGPDPADLAVALAAAVGRPEAGSQLAALFAEDHVFASDLHTQVVELLGLAPSAVGWGYGYLQAEGGLLDAPAAEHLT